MVHGLENQYSDQIDFEYVNIDNPDAAAAKKQYGFRVQPHLFLVDGDGEIVQEWVGFVTQDELEDGFTQVLH